MGDIEGMSDYLSVKEVADIVGISKQAVYSQLNNRLKEYSILIKGKKMLKKSVLTEVYDIEESQPVEQEIQPNSQDFQSTFQPNSQDFQPKIQPVEQLKDDMIALLRQQIQEKDRQIAMMQQSLEESHKLLDQEQQLHLATQQKLLMLEQKNEEKQDEVVHDAADLEESEAADPGVQQAAEQQKEPVITDQKKKGLFGMIRRMFM